MPSTTRRNWLLFTAFGLITCAWLTTADAASVDELNDLTARLQFDYYAGNARALQQDLQQLAKMELDPSLARARDYQASYGQWKLAETLRDKDRSGARRAADACIEATDKGLQAVPKRANIPRPDLMHAELHAIQAACFGVLGANSRFTKSLEAARALQPGNPRVLLVGAAEAVSNAKTAADRAVAERSIAAAVAAFDSQGPVSADVADWGHAEALVSLGDVQLQQGNRVAARNALERALVLAPDYARARELLARATGNR